MPGCCAVGCSNSRKKGFKVFRFPFREDDQQRRKAWISKIKRKNFQLTKYTVLCEAHFDKDQFEPRIPGKLKCSAIPTIFNNEKKNTNKSSLKRKEGRNSLTSFSVPTSSHHIQDQDHAESDPTNIAKVFQLDIFKFLENYEQHPCLWDQEHPGFKEQWIITASEETLLQDSGLASLADLRTIIKGIHYTYNQEKQKEKLFKKSGRDYSSQLCWFSDADRFLRENYEKLDSSSSIEDKEMKMEDDSNDSLGYDFNNNNSAVLDETSQEDYTNSTISISSPSISVPQRKKVKMIATKNKKSNEINKLEDPGSRDATDECFMFGDKEIKNEDNTNFSFEYDSNNKWKGDIENTGKANTKFKDNTNNNAYEDNSTVLDETNEGDNKNSTISISDASVSVFQGIQRKPRKEAIKTYNVSKQNSCENITGEFSMFGQHVAIQLSKLNLVQAAILQEDIQHLITEARLREIESSSWAENLKTVYNNLSGYLFLSDVQNFKKAAANKRKSLRKKKVLKQSSCEDVTHVTQEFSIFGQHVTTQLGKLPMEQALILQQDIQKLITEARLRAVESSSWAENLKSVYKNLSGYLFSNDVQN